MDSDGYSTGSIRTWLEANFTPAELRRKLYGWTPPRLGGRRSREDILRTNAHLRAQAETVRQRVRSGRYTWKQAIAGTDPFWAERTAQEWVEALERVEASAD